MWILKILPDFVFYSMLLTGLIGLGVSFVLTFVPFVTQYRVVIQVGSSILIAVGLYMAGAISDNNSWLARVSELEKRVAVAEAQSAAANTELVSKMAQKDREIAAKQAELNKRIQAAAGEMNKSCVISPEVVSILNDAATRPGAKK